MNAAYMARKAYGATAAPVRTNRSIEYAAFSRVTRDIAGASTCGPQAFAVLASAIHENRRLWSVLAADVANTENRLPNELRARIFFLAEFVNEQSRKILKGESRPDVLVEVNTAVMRGLAEEGSQE